MPRNGFRKVKKTPSMQHDPLVLDIDCSKVDLFVRDRKGGKSYRPWLTTFLNKGTGMIVGSYTNYHPPTYRSVMECLRNAIFPKCYVENKLKGTRWEVNGSTKVEMPIKRKGVSISKKGDPK